LQGLCLDLSAVLAQLGVNGGKVMEAAAEPVESKPSKPQKLT
jgi:hypothetical protein